MRIALVHDYLSQDGGAERVLKTLQEIWPEAPIFVLFHDRDKIGYFDKEKIHQSFLAKMPFVRSAYTWYLSLMPAATEQFDLRDFDVVLSSASAFAKGVIVKPGTLHISYCHTPPRYLWSDTMEYVAGLRSNLAIRALLPNILHRLRLFDRMSADRVDYFVANSHTVRERIKKYYRREAEVIHPSVDVDSFRIADKTGDYYVSGGRLVPYKRFDILVAAFNRLNWPLKIFGDGPELKRLKYHAKPNIEFLGQIPEEQKRELLSRGRAFINPQIEDFGLTAVEAMASGRPVIAYGKGGAAETVVPGVSGVFFERQNWESLLDTLLKFNHENWDSGRIREQAKKFDTPVFKEKIKNFVDEKWKTFSRELT
jgi:glycosyltransferase involved in cell wall biosynthesis